MSKQMKAGLKAGIICGILCSIFQLISIVSVIGWVFCFFPGILAVHYGKNVIKRGKDVFVSSAVAGVVYSLFLILIFLFSTSIDSWGFEDDLFFLVFATSTVKF